MRISPITYRWITHGIVAALSIVAGFVVTAYGPSVWDDTVCHAQSLWLLGSFRLISGHPTLDGIPWMAYYGPLFELLLGIGSEILFRGLHDPLWVRHALTLAVYPISLYILFHLLRANNVSRAGSLLVVAGITGYIRLGGHALFNSKDFPGAMAYVLCGIAGWTIIQATSGKDWRNRRIATLAALAVIPFLVRPPLLTYVLLFPAMIFLTEGGRAKRSTVAIFCGIAFMIVCGLSPTYWSLDVREWVVPFRIFHGFSEWVSTATAFGIQWQSNALPFWYAPLWIPVGMHPLTLIAMVVGIVGIRTSSSLHHLVLRTGKYTSTLTLRTWMWMLALGSYAAVMIVQPTLYDEDRHLLFLLPPLIVACLLGWEFIAERWKYAAAGLLLCTSMLSSAHWGQYAYVYKSPLIGQQPRGAFLGDYWGTCMTQAGVALKTVNAPTLPVKADAPAAETEVRRRRESILFRDENYARYTFVHSVPSSGSYIRIAYNRWLLDEEVFRWIKEGKATLLWMTLMPDGDPACTMAVVNGGSSDAR